MLFVLATIAAEKFSSKKPAKMTDEELAQLSSEDAEYFGHLMDRYERRLLVYIHRLLSIADADAEDILQDSFIKAYTNINNFDPDLKFSSWIYRITHNQAISYYRKQKARPYTMTSEDSEMIFHTLASELDIKKNLNKKMNAEQIRKILEDVHPKYRDVLILKFLEEKDYKEISDILKKPMGTVATLINRAKAQFKKLLITHGYEL